jgi:glycosyltransferase involved in cell wall biosynthesis
MSRIGPIYILTEARDRQITGGQKYNHYFYTELERFPVSLKYLTDDMLIRSRIPFFYNIIYLRLLFFRDMKILILDSRMYTRSVFILMLMGIFRPAIRIVCIHHHFNYLARMPRFLRPIDRMLELFFLHCCHTIIVPSPYTRDLCKRYRLDSRIAFIPIGFNKEDRPLGIPGKPGTGKSILYMGSVNRRKGTDLLVRAFSEVKRKDIQLHIAGTYTNGRFYRKIRSIIIKNGLQDKVVFHGRVEEQTISELFREAYCFLFPSRYEGFGMVIAEAFGYGLPVIAFNNSAMPYLIENRKNGILVKNGEIKEFAEAVDYLLDNKFEWDNYRQHALDSFRGLPSLDEMKKGMRKWIDNAIKP